MITRKEKKMGVALALEMGMAMGVVLNGCDNHSVKVMNAMQHFLTIIYSRNYVRSVAWDLGLGKFTTAGQGIDCVTEF